MWEKGTPRYRVAAGHGETPASRGTRVVAYARQKLTVYLTVPSTVTARDPRRAQTRPRPPAGTKTRGETR
ncbi:hypothetical protein GCM10017674_65830 [Streptomyces gardneri]|uniref:Uncharacterized protein n=1 Tax=Streptomyces gardneri TaxID=66892 RepID=A0A4Y3RXX1_9ACTN|nr:hypothetical protein SGA01_78600 [Streptomyces gardneri]GHH16064.1 hypothetical protein GCM10017674_65830 [Streptomyces gardneri]